jgi:tryptophanyl-tRNA synthetase
MLKPSNDIILSGDRPTGPLHLGHYAGSLTLRVGLQRCVHHQYLLIADLQALTDHADAPERVADNVLEVALDYLAVGLDPEHSSFVLQSGVPELSELTLLYLNLVTLARLERNPTLKAELALRGFERDVPAGFLCYPVAQAADITAFKATLVPVGEDQLPMIEQTHEIVARINQRADRPLLPRPRPVLSDTPRLPGLDGKSKASKSLGNAIALSASNDTIAQCVRSMYTDPNHLHVDDPGQVEGNVVFAYLEAFDREHETLEELKRQYRAGGLGDGVLKQRLTEILIALLEPIRGRRQRYAQEPAFVRTLLQRGTERARRVAAESLREVRGLFGLG